MARLAGKVAIVTGAAKGLGAADTRMMVREGAKVYATDVDESGLNALAGELGAQCVPVVQDVTDQDSWAALVAQIRRESGRLDILVNNAGIVIPGTILNQTYDAYRKQMAVSADATFFGCQAAIPLMVETGGGSIVNMASIASIQGEFYVIGYCAAKGAIEAMTRAIAVQCALEKNGVRCNSVHPAGIDTPMVRSMPEKMAEAGMGHVFETNDDRPRGSKLGHPDDIAHVVTFLASDESRFVNGVAMRVDQAMSQIAGVVPE